MRAGDQSGPFVLCDFPIITPSVSEGENDSLAHASGYDIASSELCDRLPLADVLIQRGLEPVFGGQSHEASVFHKLAVLEEHDRGDRADLLCGRGLGVLIGVELAHADLTSVFAGELFDGGRQALARAAPRRPEIHEHGLIGLQDFGLEVFVREGQKIFCHFDAPIKGD